MADAAHTASPWQMSRADWIAILKRTFKESSADNVGLISAGVAFYAFLAMVPLLAAVVLVYGLVANPSDVVRHMHALTTALPQQAAQLIGDQLMNAVKGSDGKKGLGLLLALAIALFGARNGAGAIIIALNIAYEEKEKRGFVKLTLLALEMTAASVIVALIAVLAIAALGQIDALIPGAPGWVLLIGKLVSYVVLVLAAAGGAAALYRWGPSRDEAKWDWLTPGSLLAAIGWLVMTLGFGIYVANFGNYNATYGSLGAVVVLLTWLYLSAYVLLLGAELNSECEHQTAADTTVGAAQPIGTRGAEAADTVVTSGDDAGEKRDAGTPSPKPRLAPPAPARAPSAAPAPSAGAVAAAGLAAWLAARRLGPVLSAGAMAAFALVARRRAKSG